MSSFFEKHDSLQFQSEPADPADYLPREQEPDSLLEQSYESRQGADIDPYDDGYEDPDWPPGDEDEEPS